MRSARVVCSVVFACILLSFTSVAVVAHEPNKQGGNSDFSGGHAMEMSWTKQRKLSWDDFKGLVPQDAEAQTAAATYCGIGFEATTPAYGAGLNVRVYNTFYIGHSWVKAEEMNDDILAHEQGHFDLCELYTRKLRERMTGVDVNYDAFKETLSAIYEQLQQEYRNRQDAYERETAHGVNLHQQKKWQHILEKELAQTDRWSEV